MPSADWHPTQDLRAGNEAYGKLVESQGLYPLLGTVNPCPDSSQLSLIMKDE